MTESPPEPEESPPDIEEATKKAADLKSSPQSDDAPPEAPTRIPHERSNGVLLGVVAALAGTVLGAVIGGVFGLLSAKAQVAGAADTVQSQFLRTQQQTAYAQFFTAQNEFQHAEMEYEVKISGSSIPDTETLVSLGNNLRDDRTKVDNALGPVALIGSEEAYQLV
jgi:hypothetical protein